jgi:hypothetical protein
LLPTLRDILNRAARKSNTSRKANCFSNPGRIVFISIFKIGAKWHIDSGSQDRSVRQHGFAIDSAVRLSDRECKPSTGGSQRLESKPLEQSGASDVPRIGDDERVIALVQRAKSSTFFGLCKHFCCSFSYMTLAFGHYDLRINIGLLEKNSASCVPLTCTSPRLLTWRG